MLLQDRDVQDGMQSRRRPRRTRLLAAGVGVAVAVPLAALAADRISDWRNPLEQEVVDRSTTPLLLALDDLHEYHAASGSFQVVVDQERDTPYVPSAISGERTTLLATGTVDAYVDFTDLDADRVTLSADGRTASVLLPAPRLAEPRVDPAQSRVLDRDRGLVERVGDALGDETTDDSALYARADEEIAVAAARSDLPDRAADNTRDMLVALGRSFGVDDVTVAFEPAPDTAG
jgi:uncharacterized protein DUF4230